MKEKFKKFWDSISINARDIISTLTWITLILFITQIVAAVSKYFGVDIDDLKDFIFAIGKFAGVALCGVGYICHITFRDSLGEHDNTEFMDTWKNKLTPKERLEWFFKICMVGLIAAALVFSIGV